MSRQLSEAPIHPCSAALQVEITLIRVRDETSSQDPAAAASRINCCGTKNRPSRWDAEVVFMCVILDFFIFFSEFPTKITEFHDFGTKFELDRIFSFFLYWSSPTSPKTSF